MDSPFSQVYHQNKHAKFSETGIDQTLQSIQSQSQDIQTSNNPVQLFIRNLSYKTTEQNLQQHFEKVGKVLQVQISKRGIQHYGFVVMEKKEETLNAICIYNNSELDGFKIQVTTSHIQPLVPFFESHYLPEDQITLTLQSTQISYELKIENLNQFLSQFKDADDEELISVFSTNIFNAIQEKLLHSSLNIQHILLLIMEYISIRGNQMKSVKYIQNVYFELYDDDYNIEYKKIAFYDDIQKSGLIGEISKLLYMKMKEKTNQIQKYSDKTIQLAMIYCYINKGQFIQLYILKNITSIITVNVQYDVNLLNQYNQLIILNDIKSTRQILDSFKGIIKRNIDKLIELDIYQQILPLIKICQNAIVYYNQNDLIGQLIAVQELQTASFNVLSKFSKNSIKTRDHLHKEHQIINLIFEIITTFILNNSPHQSQNNKKKLVSISSRRNISSALNLLKYNIFLEYEYTNDIRNINNFSSSLINLINYIQKYNFEIIENINTSKIKIKHYTLQCIQNIQINCNNELLKQITELYFIRELIKSIQISGGNNSENDNDKFQVLCSISHLYQIIRIRSETNVLCKELYKETYEQFEDQDGFGEVDSHQHRKYDRTKEVAKFALEDVLNRFQVKHVHQQ